ncbi:MAG TPA: polysaccharide biosynthesis C-terminal domain-containing protein [Bradyrhizobium sp.]|uniref:lipopolysaccharide biosynthesis protein n=1 Tax=Bradyrhizobium sp. TaxID=376 RepID=UPI002BD51F15|nr:polysaccharide biosynthesis C-terminal domain-containing protein [Bradyrhizobium sp.]HLZ01626.1 polysaccharide biosynthesis C-terminal domain-containing protein [Bradyrhizobium sp.]
MLIRHTLLYLPAQIVGPLFQLISVIVWTHVVDEHTLGVITLVTATHELLQIAFLAWWSQYALRFLGRYHDTGEVQRFHQTENSLLLASVLVQSLIVVAVLLLVIAPDGNAGLLVATVGYVITRTLNLYVGDRARVDHQVWVYTIQQIVGPAVGFVIGLLLIKLLGHSAEWPLAGYALAQLAAVVVVLPVIGHSRSIWAPDRAIVNHALKYGIPLIIGGAFGWVGLNASRFIVNDVLGVGATGLFAVGYGLGQRAATFAAMLVTAAAFPLAVKSMERDGSVVAMRQLADNGALLLAILVPSVAGIFILRMGFVHLLIATPFQQMTLAVLPLSTLAGGIRSVRAHFVDQAFLLHNRTGLMIVVTAIDAGVTVVLTPAFIAHWGLVGAAGATVVAAFAAAVVSFAIGLVRFDLKLPINHLAPITLATTVMMVVLSGFQEPRSLVELAGQIAAGATIYIVCIGLLYVTSLMKLFRSSRLEFEESAIIGTEKLPPSRNAHGSSQFSE